MLEALPRQPLAGPQVVHEIDRVLLEQPRPGAALDVLTAAVLEYHRLDAGTF